MLSRLADERLVAHSPRAGARLTARGRREALTMVRRHRILETFLVRVLGLDWSEVHEDAEVLEHHISDRVLEAIDQLMGHPHEDPHGHPIPDRRGRLRHRTLVPLATSRTHAVVREIRDADEQAALWKAGPAGRRGEDARCGRSTTRSDRISGRPFVTGSEGLDVFAEARRPRARVAAARS
jgi:DtxR family Mn-dependent transcriptional regulator